MEGQYEVVSIREFARRAGVSDTAIRVYYLETLKIPMEARTVSKGGQARLFYEPAKEAYLKYSPSTVFNESNRIIPEEIIEPVEKPKLVKEKPPVQAKVKKSIVLTPKPEAPKNTGSVSLSDRINFSKGKLPGQQLDLEEPTQKKVKEVESKEPTEFDIGRLEILESERRSKAADAKMKEMKYAEAMGKLVDKAKQDKTLFQMGIQMRDKLLSIPQRVIDNIRAADDRTEAENILTIEIHNALTGLSEFKG